MTCCQLVGRPTPTDNGPRNNDRLTGRKLDDDVAIAATVDVTEAARREMLNVRPTVFPPTACALEVSNLTGRTLNCGDIL